MDSKEKISANISKNLSQAYNTASGRVVLYLPRKQTWTPGARCKAAITIKA